MKDYTFFCECSRGIAEPYLKFDSGFIFDEIKRKIVKTALFVCPDCRKISHFSKDEKGMVVKELTEIDTHKIPEDYIHCATVLISDGIATVQHSKKYTGVFCEV